MGVKAKTALIAILFLRRSASVYNAACPSISGKGLILQS